MAKIGQDQIDTSIQRIPSEGAFADGDKTKLDGIEAGADVTDATNVISALSGASLDTTTPASDDKILVQDTSESDVIRTVTVEEVATFRQDVTIVVPSADTTSTSATWADITGLTHSADANTNYLIEIFALGENDNTSGGLGVALNGPAFTYFAAQYEGISTGNYQRTYLTAYDDITTVPANVPAANQEYCIIYRATVRTSASGTFAGRLSQNGSGTATVRQHGTVMRVTKLS